MEHDGGPAAAFGVFFKTLQHLATLDVSRRHKKSDALAAHSHLKLMSKKTALRHVITTDRSDSSFQHPSTSSKTKCGHAPSLQPGFRRAQRAFLAQDRAEPRD